jgi:hypothetical protein
MYFELLKKLYYQERAKLEESWIYKQEAKLQIINLKKKMLERLESGMQVSEIVGREDITEGVKDTLLRDGDNEDKVQERLDKNLKDSRESLTREEEDELQNARYSPQEYADYLFQAEKVFLLEAELAERNPYCDEIYKEQKTFIPGTQL